MKVDNAKIYKICGIAIKILIIALAFWFIYRRLFVKDRLDEAIKNFQDNFNQPSFIIGLLLVAALMLVNWTIETLKWRFLISKIEKLSFLNALIAVFSGITVSLFTPNRVGEYAGRVFVLEKADRWEGVLITMLGSFSQLMVTLVAGAVGFIFFAAEFLNPDGIPENYFLAIIFIASIFIILLLLLFFNVSFLTGIINKLPRRLQKLKHYGVIFSYYSKAELLLALLMSLVRYMVFVTQFYLLLRLFGVNIPFCYSLLMVSMIFLSMAAIPTIALTELGVRGSVALYFIGLYFIAHHAVANNDLGIITALSVLWLINLAIPALLGAVFVFRLKFFLPKKNPIK